MEHLANTHKALGSILSTEKKEKKVKEDFLNVIIYNNNVYYSKDMALKQYN
jgi:hypothetical protein